MIAQFFELLGELITDHWLKVVSAAALMLVGWWLGKRRARAQWQKKEFLNRLNISLNILRDGKLQIRTLSEKSLDEIFLNAVAVQKVLDAAQHTTEENPILPLADEDRWYLLNSVLNEVAEQYGAGYLHRDLGLPVTAERYLICLTRERAGEMKTHKVRAMLVRKAVLVDLADEAPELESPRHITRVETLRKMAEVYRKAPDHFMEVEICLPAAPSSRPLPTAEEPASSGAVEPPPVRKALEPMTENAAGTVGGDGTEL
jgi:hypothetical protein